MRPVSEITPAQAAGLRYVLTDIDDTLTRQGKLLSSSYTALWKLRAAGLKVIPVTGRPAGWCDCIVRQWPVDGIVGENGALAFWEEAPAGESPRLLPRLPILKSMYHPDAIKNNHPVLRQIREQAMTEVSGLRDAKDQFSRLFDITLDYAEEEPVLPLSAAEKVQEIARARGAVAKISSIHINIWMGNYDKLSMAERFLTERFGWQGDVSEVLFMGDSPNDEPMFAHFPLACAVANIRRYQGLITTLPAFVAAQEGGDGFAEIAETVLAQKRLSHNSSFDI
ncbi:MAG: HAD hydrolase family protein [Treponema sp.]|jgi:hydroxymethylpyrimidine pyrophosphatase-like HAD family hydrolase|nr:HAD hydrolase family protein [Treponema sp.]